MHNTQLKLLLYIHTVVKFTIKSASVVSGNVLASRSKAEVEGFFSERKNPEHKSSGGDFKLGVPNLRFQAR